jgi:hypothetical protein
MLIHALAEFLNIVRDIGSDVEKVTEIFTVCIYVLYSTVLDQRTMYFLASFAEKDTFLVFFNKTSSGISLSTIRSLISVILSINAVLARRKEVFPHIPVNIWYLHFHPSSRKIIKRKNRK